MSRDYPKDWRKRMNKSIRDDCVDDFIRACYNVCDTGIKPRAKLDYVEMLVQAYDDLTPDHYEEIVKRIYSKAVRTLKNLPGHIQLLEGRK